MSNARKVSTLIVDDEPVARAGLHAMLAPHEWIDCVGEASDGLAAVDAINRLRPDLVFLDIQMPGLLGTDVLRRVEHRPHVVFTTAYAQHAVIAFELGALDYLLKPFGPTRLAATLDRVHTTLIEQPVSSALRRLQETFSAGVMSRLFVRSSRSIIPIALENVSWFDAQGDYVAAHVGTTRYLLHLSLNHIEARLDPKRFARIHRAHIVNLDCVKGFRRAGKGRFEAELTDGTRLSVSRARSQEIRGLGV